MSNRRNRTGDAGRAEDHQHEVRFGRGWYPRFIRVLAWLCFAGLIVAAVYVLAKPEPPSHPDLKRVSELTGLRFPAEAWLFESEMIQPHGLHHLRAQVKVRRTGLPVFLQSVPQSLSESRAEWPWLPRYIDSDPDSLLAGSEPWPEVSSRDRFVTYAGVASHDGRAAQVTIFVTLNESRIARIWIDWESRASPGPPSP